MTEKGEKEEEEKVPRTLLKAVDDFYKEREAVFREFDEIQEKHLKGEEISGELKRFRSRRVGIFTLIYDIFHKEVDLEEKLDNAGTAEEKRAKIAEFKDRFAVLADEIDLLVLEELGLGGR